ncbi:hypothetical protein [Tenacibaculum sp.]
MDFSIYSQRFSTEKAIRIQQNRKTNCQKYHYYQRTSIANKK